MARKKGGKPKRTTIRQIEEPELGPVQKLLDEAVRNWHPELLGATFALLWKEFKPDKDGHVVLGTARKATDESRELASYDLAISLNREAWEGLTDAQRLALLDHEAEHLTTALDEETGETKVDDRGRICYRVRQHDLNEFRSVVRRHGCYLADIEEFVRAATEAKEAPLFRIAANEG